MVNMKKNTRYVKAIPCLALLCLFSIVQFSQLRIYIKEIVNTSGMGYQNFEKELKAENERAAEDERAYQKMIGTSQPSEQDAEELPLLYRSTN
jgi:deoxycytidylate deaminase